VRYYFTELAPDMEEEKCYTLVVVYCVCFIFLFYFFISTVALVVNKDILYSLTR